MTRTHEPIQVGALFAPQLFGSSQPEQPKPVVRNFRKQTSRRKLDPATRTERVAFAEITQDTPPVRAIQPLLTKEAKHQTMINYRAFRKEYNESVEIKNRSIELFNCAIKVAIINKKLNEVQLRYSKLFYSKNHKLKAVIFNQLAEKFNSEYGNCVELKKIQPLKSAAEPIFFQMLHLYSIQMELQTLEFIKVGVSEPSTVPQFEINPSHLTNLRREDDFTLDLNNKTIRNYKERFEEAGILYHYYFQGHKKGVKMHINSQILTVFDAKTSKMTTTENQALTHQKGKNVTYNNEATRAFKTNINKRENGQAAFLDKGTASPGFSFVFYKNTLPQDENSKLGGGCENVKVSETLSDLLENQIIPDQALAKNLSAGVYNNYSRIKKTVLEKEAYSGTMSRENAKRLAIQIFFKYSAKLYRGKNVYVGSWKIAINYYMEKMFLVNNGNGTFLYSKALIFEKLEEMLWRIDNAAQWFNKTKINPLFPNQYFDFTRKTAKEIGFEYTEKAYKKHVEYLATKPRKQKEVAKKAAERVVKINFSKKFDTKVTSFFKNRISFTDLIDYVNTNLPAEYLQKLHIRIMQQDQENISKLN
jgi:hypothetical protein